MGAKIKVSLKPPACHPRRPYWAKDLCRKCYLASYYHANEPRLVTYAHTYYVNHRQKQAQSIYNSKKESQTCPIQQ